MFVFWCLVFLGAFVFWIRMAEYFEPIGQIVSRIWDDATNFKNDKTEDEKNEK